MFEDMRPRHQDSSRGTSPSASAPGEVRIYEDLKLIIEVLARLSESVQIDKPLMVHTVSCKML